jgi:hypothetical protein
MSRKSKYSFRLILAVSFSITVGFNSLQSIAQENHAVGYVYNSEDFSPLHNVHVINTKTNRGVVSGIDGKFLISASGSDTLFFRSVGFKDTLIALTGTGELRVFMTPAIYPIGEVTILPYGNYADFKQAFKDLEVDKPMQFDPSYFLSGKAPASGKQGFGLTIDGPITALYNAFSREGKQMRNYERFMRESAIHEEVGRKYNVQIVRRLTGIEDDMEAIRFMQYCSLDTNFIVKATEYELLLAVKSCYEAYLQEK